MQRDGQSVPAKRWNRAEVNRYLLPVLKHVDPSGVGCQEGEDRSALLAQAKLALSRDREGYAQLSHVFRSVSDELYSQWFGWIACDEQLLLDAFDWIDACLQGKEEAGEKESLERELYFASLFRIGQGEGTVDLAHPFEQYYFCDPVIYQDYLFRRIELGEACKAAIRQYLPYYNRIRAWYREHGGKQSGVGPVYDTYMQLLDHFQGLVDHETHLRDSIQALEYERQGLGWFRRARKREIESELALLYLQRAELKEQQAVERYEAYEAQFADQRERWQRELANAPVTAFGRKKELKQKLSDLKIKLENYRAELGLEELGRTVKQLTKEWERRK